MKKEGQVVKALVDKEVVMKATKKIFIEQKKNKVMQSEEQLPEDDDSSSSDDDEEDDMSFTSNEGHDDERALLNLIASRMKQNEFYQLGDKFEYRHCEYWWHCSIWTLDDLPLQYLPVRLCLIWHHYHFEFSNNIIHWFLVPL